MKTVIHDKSLTNILFLLILIACLHLSGSASGQFDEQGSNEYLKSLPKDFKLVENTPQQYYVTTKQYNRDIYGNFMNQLLVSGYVTRGLEGGDIMWNDVRLAQSNSQEELKEGTPITYMENFTYHPSEDMVTESAFKDFPQDINSVYAKNLVWDWMAIETFAWQYFDSLELNVTYSPNNINGVVDLAGMGYFENKDIKLTWKGVSERNNEFCALIDFRTFNNPLGIKNEQMDMKGRSHYWGTVWVSLEDKQIEHAILFEDVVLEIKMTGMDKMLINAMRELVYTKQNIDL